MNKAGIIKVILGGVITLSSFFLIGSAIMPSSVSYSQLVTVSCDSAEVYDLFKPTNFTNWSSFYAFYRDSLSVSPANDSTFEIYEDSKNELIHAFNYVPTDYGYRILDDFGKNKIAYKLLLENGSDGFNVKLLGQFDLPFLKRLVPGLLLQEMMKNHIDQSLELIQNRCNGE